MRTDELNGEDDYEYDPLADLGGKEMRGTPGEIRALKHWIYLRNAVAILGELREPRSRVALEQLLIDHEVHKDVRGAALSSLARIGDERSIACLRQIAGDPSDYYQIAAIEAISDIGGEQAVKALEEISAVGKKRSPANSK